MSWEYADGRVGDPHPDTLRAAGSRGGPGGFFGIGPTGGLGLNGDDVAALAQENSNVVTDLSKLGKPGTRFTRDFFLSATLLSFPQEAVAEVAKIEGVAAATGALTQLANHQTGTVPAIVHPMWHEWIDG